MRWGKRRFINNVGFLPFSRRIVQISSSGTAQRVVLPLRGNNSPRHRRPCGPRKADAIFGCGSHRRFGQRPFPQTPITQNFWYWASPAGPRRRVRGNSWDSEPTLMRPEELADGDELHRGVGELAQDTLGKLVKAEHQ